MLDTWKSQEYTHIQKNRLLLERASGIILKKAAEFIGKVIEGTLGDWNLGDIHGDGNLGRHGAMGEKKVCQRVRPSTYADKVTHREARFPL